MSAPGIRLLDLGCGAGGASYGYWLAGRDSAERGGPGITVTGVDIAPQPRYPFTFIQADALDFPLRGYDVVAASMPCHDHTPLAALTGKNGTGHLLGAVRDRMTANGKPWVIENVPGAPMRPDLKLCGCMTDPPLRTYRLRWFELSGHFGHVEQPRHRDHSRKTATTRRRERWDQGWHISVTGDVGTYCGPEAMGIDWMTGNELSQAIPPVYTRFIGAHLLAALR